MPFRSIRLAYVVPPLLALFLGVIGLVQVDQDGIVGVSGVVTAVGESGAETNDEIARRLQEVAADHGGTIVRVVADRKAPTSRRVVLVTTAPSSRGAAWLDGGYQDFSRSMSTHVRPISDLDRYDTAGTYQVIGDGAMREALGAALESAGFIVSSEAIPIPARLGMSAALDDSSALVGALMMGCAALCLVGTIGAPRRSAVRRMSGHSTRCILATELAEARVTLITSAIASPLAALALWLYNDLASCAALAQATLAFLVVLLLPVVASHAVGTLFACRVPIAAAIRGARPPAAVVAGAHLARLPAAILVVGTILDLVGTVAVARSGDTDRELRAAGAAVQLWVTPEPRPGVETQEYWERIGRFAGQALDHEQAFLAAKVETGAGGGTDRTVPALIVDAGYLRHQPLRSVTGERISAASDRIDVWIPEASQLDRRPLIESLKEWELRDAPPGEVRAIGGGRLRDEATYSYPGSSGSAPWMAEAVIVVVPNPSAVFSPDQLGSWLSTGDVVFTSEHTADQAVAASGLDREFNAVVAVGQDAAERTRRAAATARVQTAGLVSTVVVALVLTALAVSTHRRRHGRWLFLRISVGLPFIRADAALLALEGSLLGIGLVFVVKGWWARVPGGSEHLSPLDPIARSATGGASLAAVSAVALATISVAVLVWTGRRTHRSRGRDT